MDDAVTISAYKCRFAIPHHKCISFMVIKDRVHFLAADLFCSKDSQRREKIMPLKLNENRNILNFLKSSHIEVNGVPVNPKG